MGGGSCPTRFGLTAAFFLLRSRELHCRDDHSIAAEFLNYADEVHEPLLRETYRCLIQHATARLVNGSLAGLVTAECEWEIELLEHVHEAIPNPGSPAFSDTDAIYWVAQMRWHRFLLLADAGYEAEAELIRSLADFAAVYVPGRTLLPPLVREYLQCLDPGSVPSEGLIDRRYRSSSAMGIRLRETARRVLVTRVNRGTLPRRHQSIWRWQQR